MDEMANPLREGLQGERIPAPTTMVIFGASGDLTKRKLVPALYSLARDRLLPPTLQRRRRRAPRPSATTRSARRCASRRDKYARRRPVEEALWKTFSDGIFYVDGHLRGSGDLRAAEEARSTRSTASATPGNRVFYLSTPPSEYPVIVKHLGARGPHQPRAHGAVHARHHREAVRPRSGDARARSTRSCTSVLREDQIYRIDHYLGKETVQNILVFRFANGICEPLWNNRYVDHVQITVAESIGVEGRGGYFEQAGILRDMVQNHMFQFLCLIGDGAAGGVRGRRRCATRSSRCCARSGPAGRAEEIERHRRARAVRHGLRQRPGDDPRYREEPGVGHGLDDRDLRRAQAAHRQLALGGRAVLPARGQGACPSASPRSPSTSSARRTRSSGRRRAAGSPTSPNVLSIRIQPDEGISLKFGSKVPGPTMELPPVTMEFRYGTSFGAEPPEAYERLILDCLLGDGTLFTRGDEVEASWAWIDRIEKAWRALPAPPFPNYAAGTWGPAEADRLIEGDGRVWRKP